MSALPITHLRLCSVCLRPVASEDAWIILGQCVCPMCVHTTTRLLETATIGSYRFKEKQTCQTLNTK